MVSDSMLVLLLVCIVAILSFVTYSIRKGNVRLIHKLYFCLSFSLVIWLGACVGIYFTDPGNTPALEVWDALTYLGGPFACTLALLISMVFVTGWEKLPRKCFLLFIPPVITNLLVWTNPLHHLIYRTFSVDNSAIEFGPLMFVAGLFSYIPLMASIVVMITFAVRSKNRLYMWQALFFVLGDLPPMVVNIMATLKLVNVSLVATPLSFALTIVFHGFSIFYFHLLDIKPLALQRVLERLSDCYLVLSDTGLVVDFNRPFYETFGKQYGIQENVFLQNCTKKEGEMGGAFYTLLSSVEACRNSKSNISYEQTVLLEENQETVKKYYMVEITPILVEEEKLGGFLAFFKDVTKVKESMQKLQNSQAKLMEQERLASLGQMVGGIAHNLKTPIMSISGSMIALENLLNECGESLGDPDVTEEDYREIYEEAAGWVEKVREACAYMSDIISAVKGQAVNMSLSETGEFRLEDALKRVFLLPRHELVGNGCKLEVVNSLGQDPLLQGDINSLVQVLNNLVTNAVDAEKAVGGGSITICLEKTETELQIQVKDRGTGVPEEIKRKLFRQMVTNKGALGTGLGIYISNSVIRARFNGRMWVEDNPGGGAVFGIAIPLQYVDLVPQRKEESE